jgi:hypothetical protein
MPKGLYGQVFHQEKDTANLLQTSWKSSSSQFWSIYIVKLPIAKDLILVWNTETGKKDKRVPKQLRMISIRELHNDLLKPVDEGRFKYALTEARKSSSATLGYHCCPWS